MQYALIKDNAVANIIEADATFADSIRAKWQHVMPAGGAAIGWSWNGSALVAPSSAPGPAPRHISRRAFRARFTKAERAAVEWAAVDKPEAPTAERLLSAQLRADLKDQEQATYIDLDDPDTKSGLQALEAMGLLAAGRADAILDAPVQPHEKP